MLIDSLAHARERIWDQHDDLKLKLSACVDPETMKESDFYRMTGTLAGLMAAITILNDEIERVQKGEPCPNR